MEPIRDKIVNLSIYFYTYEVNSIGKDVCSPVRTSAFYIIYYEENHDEK